jgi:AraC-like DNA-binding protein
MSLPEKLMNRKEEITAQFLQLAEEHISDILKGNITHRYGAGDFARQLFIHSRHLTNTIKLTTGKSPCDIMEERLMQEAQRLLTTTTISVADISILFGYNDPANFIRFFKGMCGITPLQYRKQHAPAA